MHLLRFQNSRNLLWMQVTFSLALLGYLCQLLCSSFNLFWHTFGVATEYFQCNYFIRFAKPFTAFMQITSVLFISVYLHLIQLLLCAIWFFYFERFEVITKATLENVIAIVSTKTTKSFLFRTKKNASIETKPIKRSLSGNNPIRLQMHTIANANGSAGILNVFTLSTNGCHDNSNDDYNIMSATGFVYLHWLTKTRLNDEHCLF